MNPQEDTQWTLVFRYVAGILFFACFVAFLFYAHDAVRNLVIAAFVAYLISPAVEYVQNRLRISRAAAVNLVYFSSLILLVGVPATLAPIFYDEAQSVIQDLLNLTTQLGNLLAQPVRLGGLVFHLETWSQGLLQVKDALLTPLPEEALQLLETTSVGVLWFLIILVCVYLFLAEWQNMRESLFNFALPVYRHELEELYRRIRRVWMGYLRGQIVLMIIVGVVFTIAWTIMGIPGALVLGVLAGLFTLVPDVGPFVAVTLAAGVALLEGSTWIKLAENPNLNNFLVAGLVVAVYLVLINLKNFFLRPIIMGRSVHMNEGLVFVVILIATMLEGILGALLVVPVLASVVIIARYFRRKVLGMPAFEDADNNMFVAPPEKIHPPRRTLRRKPKPTDGRTASDSPAAASSSSATAQSKTSPLRKKRSE